MINKRAYRVAKKESRQYKNSEATKKAIIDAAGKLAGHHGFHSISTRAIADASKENLGSIHYHFGSKTNLFKAVIDDAARDCVEYTAYDAIAPYQETIDTKESQTKTIRALVHRHITKLFNPEKPTWHSKVIYQILQTKNELQDYLMDIFLNDDIEVTKKVIKQIVPGISDDNAQMHSVVMATPAFFHAINMEFILMCLDKKEYGQDYLERLEDIMVQQTLLLFELPLDKEIDLRK